MTEKIKRDPYFTAAILITIANVVLLWTFRFLPLYDYPIWLYEVRIMRALSEPVFQKAYELAMAPIPNLGFVGPVWLLSFVLPLEISGKIFLSLCVITFPWTFWHCVRKLSGNPDSPLAYIGFVFAFNTYFFAGNAFLCGFIFLMMMIGYYVPKIDRLSRRDWWMLSVFFLLGYFMHLLSFILLLIAFVGAIVFTKEWKKQFTALCCAVLPSLACFVWYVLTALPTGATYSHWTAWGLAQNILKPIFLLIKSYSIPNPLPLTALNILWFAVVAVVVGLLVVNTRKTKSVDRRFIIPAVTAFVLALALPGFFSGVKEPGTRFGLPFFFFVLMMFSRSGIAHWWKSVFLSVALLVNIYNAFHFKRVDEQMREMYRDLTTNVQLEGKSFRAFRFDYPPPRNAWDIAAASIDPLFGVSSYAAIERNGAGTWIFGSSQLRYAKGYEHLHPVYDDETTALLAHDLFSDSTYSFTYDVAVLVGNNTIVDERMTDYKAKKFRGKFWMFLEPLNSEASSH